MEHSLVTGGGGPADAEACVARVVPVLHDVQQAEDLKPCCGETATPQSGPEWAEYYAVNSFFMTNDDIKGDLLKKANAASHSFQRGHEADRKGHVYNLANQGALPNLLFYVRNHHEALGMCCPSRFNVITPQKSCWRFTSTLAWTLMCFYHWQIQAYKGDHVAEDYTTGVMRDYVNPAVGYLSVTLFMFVQFKFVRKLIVHSICCCFPIASRVTLCKLTTLYFAWSLAGLGCVFMGLPMSTTTIDKKFILWNGGPNQCTAEPFDPRKLGVVDLDGPDCSTGGAEEGFDRCNTKQYYGEIGGTWMDGNDVSPQVTASACQSFCKQGCGGVMFAKKSATHPGGCKLCFRATMFIDRGIASEQLGFLQRANADKTFGAIGDWWVPKATTHYTLFAKEGDSKEARITQQAKWRVNANFTDRGHMPCFEVCPRTWPHVFMYDFFVLGYFKPMLISLFFLSITMLRPASLDGKAWYVVSMLIGQFIDSWTEGQPIALDRGTYDGEIADGMSVGGFVDWCRIHEASCGRSVTPLEEAPAAARDPERGGSDAVTNPLQKRTMVTKEPNKKKMAQAQANLGPVKLVRHDLGNAFSRTEAIAFCEQHAGGRKAAPRHPSREGRLPREPLTQCDLTPERQSRRPWLYQTPHNHAERGGSQQLTA